jgi:hypothetical protein
MKANLNPAMTSMTPSNIRKTGLLNFVAPSVEPMNPPQTTATDQKAMWSGKTPPF